MCIRNIINNSNDFDSLIKHPIRKSRTKRRRPKFLSLRSELNSQSPMTQNPKPPPPPPPPQKQLTLFPLHPENLVDDREDDSVALIFENDVVSSSLHGFLPSYQNDMSSEEESRNLAALVRTAMRGREREAAAAEEEEKWVCYSEVVEKKEEEEEVVPSWTAVEEVTSTAVDHRKKIKKKKKKKAIGKKLRLKLDYEGILNAWSDKAPLFINGESPQIVPDLHDHHPTFSSDSLPNRSSSSSMMEGMGSEGGNLWKVPEMGILLKKEELLIMGQREASVLRYKEKRQNRLFSKRIRYEVRKLNAEKRPRMKGRFVKRS